MHESYPNLKTCDPRTCIASKVMKVHRIVNGIFRQELKDTGLTNSQLSMLFVLSQRQDMTQTDLTNFLFLEKSSLSRNMNRLLANGCIDKKESPLVHITEKGLALLDQCIPAWERAMTRVSDRLGLQGTQALDKLLHQLTE